MKKRKIFWKKMYCTNSNKTLWIDSNSKKLVLNFVLRKEIAWNIVFLKKNLCGESAFHDLKVL